MFVRILCVLAFVLIAVNGTCQSVDGQSVPWWILYQQKNRPYFHQYVDSTNSQRIKEHYPEKVDSVLSRVMSSVLDHNEAEYIIYSSDLVNVKDIAAKSSIPTYSKWMHGILGTVSSWETGFWILHNNLLFPAIKNGVLAKPGSKAWYSTTVGDSSADLFYICLNADNKGNITAMLTSIMAGNPFIYKRKLHNHNFLQPYLKEVRSLQTSFGYEMSAVIFMNCMNTSRTNVSTNCMFTYAVTTGIGIRVFTRPRGMIKHSSTFCYDEQSLYYYDFLKLEKRSTLMSGFTHSMFALSDQSDSSAIGMTCFGQDVAANAETVAVMICAKLPSVHVNVIKSARFTQWSCHNRDDRPKRTAMHKQGVEKHSTVVKRTNFFPNSNENNKDASTNNRNDKGVVKFCHMYNCDDNFKYEEQFQNGHLKNPFSKNQKTAKWFDEIVSDIKMEYNIKNKRKRQKTIKQENNAIKVKGSLEVNRYLLLNEKAVLGLFCQEGCRFCQKAREQIILLAKLIQSDNLDFVIIDIKEPALPEYLRVPFTPYIRYKFSRLSEWNDYSGKKYDIEHIVIFLRNSTKRSSEGDYTLADSITTLDTHIDAFSNLEIGERKRRENRQTFEGQNKLGLTKNGQSRTKREIYQDFIDKHIWHYQGDVTRITTIEVIAKYIEVKVHNPRRNKNTFLVTRNIGETVRTLDAKIDDFLERRIYVRDGMSFYFPPVNIIDIHSVLVHYVERGAECWYSTIGNVYLTEFVNHGRQNVLHFNEFQNVLFRPCVPPIPNIPGCNVF